MMGRLNPRFYWMFFILIDSSGAEQGKNKKASSNDYKCFVNFNLKTA